MSNDALIRNLATDLAPVRRRSVPREILMLLALGIVELAVVLGVGAMRPDMGMMMGSSYLLWRTGSLAILAAICCIVAIRSFSPPASPRRGLRLALAVSGLAVIAGAFVGSAAERGRSLLDRLSPGNGMVCAVAIILLALPMMALLGVLMRRAAPADPQRSAWAAGLAAGSCGALIFTVCCPMNDPLYIALWYPAGCAGVAATARWLLPRHLRL